MEAVTAVALQQATQQTNVGLALVKKNAQAEQSLVNMLIQNSSADRGQNVDITV